MANKKSTNFVIDCVVYKFSIMFSFGQTDATLEKALTKYGIEFADELKGLGITKKGICLMLPCNSTVIRMPVFPESCSDYGTLQHEIFHAVQMIMDKVGMQLTWDNDEAFAHLIGYITEKVYQRINKFV